MDNTGGRPRALTDEKRDELIHHIGRGATVAEAAGSIGVSLRTVQREAKEDKEFAKELELARGSVPTDPYELMLRAARTHWRAAAWLLERTDPDRFGKRPPNSCRPEEMMELASSLIEAALEFVPPDQRELVDDRLEAIAEAALEAAMPYQRQRPTAAFHLTPSRYGNDPIPDWLEQALASEDEAASREEEEVDWEASDSQLAEKRVLSPKMRVATKPSVSDNAATAANAAAHPPTLARKEVLSPEMRIASEPETETTAAQSVVKLGRAADRKTLHTRERDLARRARRQAARAKRKARKAA
jgi:hypothetical protein